jgi:hypothetical protein
MRRVRAVLALASVLSITWACGSRTGLLVDEVEELDAGRDAARGRDTGRAQDATRDSARDSARDVMPPPIDARPMVDVDRRDCQDAASTLIYAVGNGNELYSFYPPDQAFKLIGTLACPTDATPFSMAVDRRGVAYVLYNNGELFRVSTLNASCTPTRYVPGQEGFQEFGMGFSSDRGGPEETLFVSADQRLGGTVGLGKIDPRTFALSRVSNDAPPQAELTGTGDGRLYAYYAEENSTSSFIGEIEKTSGRVIAEKELAGVAQGTGWAFAFWGGDFYVFTGDEATSTVVRYRPGDDSVISYTTAPALIVGAGVSTCAPSE